MRMAAGFPQQGFSTSGALERVHGRFNYLAAETAEAREWREQARQAVSVYEAGLRPLARRNLDTVRETYQLGRATVFDVLAEQRRYLEAERAYTAALSE